MEKIILINKNLGKQQKEKIILVNKNLGKQQKEKIIIGTPRSFYETTEVLEKFYNYHYGIKRN